MAPIPYPPLSIIYKVLVIITGLFWISPAYTQDLAASDNLTSSGKVRKQYYTQSTGDELIRLDGMLNEPAWDKVEWGLDFIQHEPDNGNPPSHQSAFKILYDKKYLYIGFRAYDSCPDSIVARLCRRDEFAGDWMEINIDSYHDMRSAFSFTQSVSGVKNDEFVSNDGDNWDTSWNPVWDSATHLDSLGWTAELKIPFSQLRYGTHDNPVWGLQVMRRLFRKEERSTWQPIPKSSNGWVSQYGELHGLTDLPRNTQIEIAPYVSAQTESFERVEGNPFADGSRSSVSAGVDGKISVTRDMILDFTVNPDFGQVEADPGAVRLDGYEIFFREQRPFFIESRNLFDYPLAGSVAGGSYDDDQVFYSRRIGGAPHNFPDLIAGEFVEIPSNTSILGAAKFSGKTKGGLSIGILESITQAEHAKISFENIQREVLVEPLTSYFVGRALQDINEGNTIIGGVVTSVNRKAGIPDLHKSALTGGLDIEHFWKNRWWYMRLNVLMSHVEGTQEAILNTQTSFVHLLQRTDAGYLEVDPQRTSLTGTGGTFKIGKFGGTEDKNGGIWKFETGVTWRSPLLELNDIGFLLAADEINHFAWGSYNIIKPFSIFNSANINYNHWGKWDFGGNFLYNAFNTNLHFWFKNQWRIGSGFTYNPHDISNNALRGTTALRKPPGYGHDIYFNSDSRKKVTFQGSFSHGGAFPKAVSYIGFNVGLQIQPFDNLRFSIDPGYSRSTRKQDQFVANVPFNGNVRSIVSYVEQRNFSLSTRLNYYITPDLTIQYYGEPFIFRALFKNYGFVQDPLNKNYDARFHTFSTDEISIQSGTAFIDEDNDGQTDYTFNTPDLNFIQFRSNLVLRWEYVAGSEFFLVWSQGIIPNAFGDIDSPLLESLSDNIFDQQPHNIFLAKFSYRFLK